MGKKYIVEIGRLERLYKAYNNGNGMPNMTWLSPEVDLTPYTEPDLEQVRKEAYDKGCETAKHECEQCRKVRADAEQELAEKAYQRGLNDAWEAARKIVLSKESGGLFDYDSVKAVFGCGTFLALKKYSASEAIEKIRQYEQEKEKKDGVWIASETWIMSEANEPSVDTTLICSKCGYEIKIKPHETPALNFCPKCGDCKKPKEEES